MSGILAEDMAWALAHQIGNGDVWVHNNTRGTTRAEAESMAESRAGWFPVRCVPAAEWDERLAIDALHETAMLELAERAEIAEAEVARLRDQIANLLDADAAGRAWVNNGGLL